MSDFSCVRINFDSCKAFDSLREDDSFQHFLSPSFDPQSSVSLQGMSINDQIAKITSGIDALNQELHSLVSDHYEDLIIQATKLETLEDVLKTIQSRIQALLDILERLRTKLCEPYNRIAHRIVLLNRLQTTCDLLRKIMRVMNVTKRLQQSHLLDRDLSTASREIVKGAQSVSELDALLSSDESLLRIEVIQSDISLVRELKAQILERADEMLSLGLQKQDSGLINTSVQVFLSLGVIDHKLTFVLKEKRETLSKAIKATFDVHSLTQTKAQGPGGVVMPITTGQTANLRTSLWAKMQKLSEEMYLSFSQIQILYRVVKTKREPANGSFSVEGLSISGLLSDFFHQMTSLLSQQMCVSANESMALKEALETEYPKMVSLFSDLWTRMAREEKEVNAEKLLRAALQPFESAYLSRSVCLLHDSVNKLFADAKESTASGVSGASACPSSDDIDAIVRTISSELQVASIDPQLGRAVGRNVGKAVHILVNKFEDLIRVDGDATQVIDSPSKSQRLNSMIVHRLDLFQKRIQELLTSVSCPEETLKAINDSLATVDPLMRTTVQPLLNSVMDSIEAIILTMHNENFLNCPSDAQCSPYMRELQGFIDRVQKDYFSLLPENEAIESCALKVAARTVELFLRHTTLIRPLGSPGKMRLTADYAQLEMALAPICQRMGDLGRSYRSLRAFKPLLFQEAEAISQSPVVGDLIPYSIALQFLISSFGPTEMKSPHDNRNWSVSRYTKWMDEHEKESDRLSLIKDTLETYVKQVQQQQGKAFASIYLIVLRLLQKGLEEHSPRK